MQCSDFPYLRMAKRFSWGLLKPAYDSVTAAMASDGGQGASSVDGFTCM